jgi:hypothetical protein
VAAAIQRVAIGEVVIPAVITISQDQSGEFWLRIEDEHGASDYQQTKSSLLALAAAITTVANS